MEKEDIYEENTEYQCDDINNSLQNAMVLDLIPWKEIYLPHPSEKKLPKLPDKVGEMYPAIAHKVYSTKGRIFDNWWKIVWFDDQQDAIKSNLESQREAESFYITKEFFDNIRGKITEKLI